MSFLDFVLKTPVQIYDRWLCNIGNRYKKLDDRSGEQDVTNKVVVITGANAGLGKCVAHEMAKRGAIVVMCCRDLTKANVAVKEIQGTVPDATLHVIPLDLSKMDSVRTCANEIFQKFPFITILINNAGIMSSKIERTPAGFEKQLATNHLGHMLFTMLLLGHLRLGAPSRIVCLGSLLYTVSKLQMDDLNWEKQRSTKFLSFAPYNDSKRCCMLFSKELGRRLEGTGVTTYSLCPGLAKTDLLQNLPLRVRFMTFFFKFLLGCTVPQGAASILYCALADEISQETGRAYHFGRFWTKANRELGDEEAVQVWREGEKLLGTSFERYFLSPSNSIVNINGYVGDSSLNFQD